MAEKITVSVRIQAPCNKVWKYFTEPDHVTQWNHASDDWHSPRAENDLSVGGKFIYRMESKDGNNGFDFGGTYTDIIPEQKISFMIDDGRTVEVLFDENNGQTDVTETFEAENTNSVEVQRSGWQSILDNFKKHVEQS